MVIRDGKCYAENPVPVLKIVSARLLAPYQLEVAFNTGEKRLFDGHCLLGDEVFAPLADAAVFADYQLDYETLTWLNGEVDIAPEYVHAHSVRQSKVA